MVMDYSLIIDPASVGTPGTSGVDTTRSIVNSGNFIVLWGFDTLRYTQTGGTGSTLGGVTLGASGTFPVHEGSYAFVAGSGATVLLRWLTVKRPIPSRPTSPAQPAELVRDTDKSKSGRFSSDSFIIVENDAISY